MAKVPAGEASLRTPLETAWLKRLLLRARRPFISESLIRRWTLAFKVWKRPPKMR